VKTTGVEMVTEIFLYLADENMIKVIPDFLNNENYIPYRNGRGAWGESEDCFQF
jgi:hypothetical protein